LVSRRAALREILPAEIMVAEPVATERFGPYVVYERLGVGGMATVHRALERGGDGSERVVALKRLLPHLADDAAFVKSFVREAKLASLLQHVNIVQIYELGRVGGEYFISMEYIDGRDVRRLLRHARRAVGPPPVDVAVGIVIQLCDALDYAHNKGDDAGALNLVHRDISPSNVIVTRDGTIKVIDFGIAKAQGRHTRTHTGKVKGKLAYLAPEAVTSTRDLDARSDLWAAGVILHELLTARPLFACKNEYETLLRVQKGEIAPPSTFNHACPPELDEVVLRALARDPDERFASAAELRAELHAVRRSHQLRSGGREIAEWIEWAFSVEAPANPVDGRDTPGSLSPPSRSKPRKPAVDEEAVEAAWGSDDSGVNGGPVLLDDVPDVSEKHRAPDLRVTPRMSDPSLDDIPTPVPTHGELTRERTASEIVPLETRLGAEPLEPPAPPAPAPAPAPAPKRPRTLPGVQVAEPLPGDTFDDDVGASFAIDHLEPITTPVARRLHEDIEEVLELHPQPEHVIPVVRFSKRQAAQQDPTSASASALASNGGRATGAAPAIDVARAVDTARWKRAAIVAAGIVVVGGAAVVAYVATRGGDDEPAVGARVAQPPDSARATAVVAFDITPTDADIVVDGRVAHAGSPWRAELAVGVHEIEIRHARYKSKKTSLELAATARVTPVHVGLDPLSETSTPESTSATLVITTVPAGLVAVIDDRVQPSPTPIRTTVAPGAHTIAVRANGVDVWRHKFTAEPNVDYEYNPTLELARKRAVDPPPPPAPRAPAPVTPPPATPPADDAAAEATQHEPPPAPTNDDPPVAPPPAPPPVTPPPQQPSAPPPSPRSTAPAVVPSTAVTKRSGAVPTLSPTRADDLPTTISAKVCIDTSGRVATAEVLSKIDHRSAAELADAIRTWTYAPYTSGGVAVPACFIVSFRVK
jgi:serine/threonine protein kinase